MSTFEIDLKRVLLIFSSLMYKVEIYLKYFFDKFIQKQLLCGLARIQVYGACCSAQTTHKLKPIHFVNSVCTIFIF